MQIHVVIEEAMMEKEMDMGVDLRSRTASLTPGLWGAYASGIPEHA